MANVKAAQGNIFTRHLHFNEQKDRYEPSQGDCSTYLKCLKNETIQAVKQPAHGTANVVSGVYDFFSGMRARDTVRMGKAYARAYAGTKQIILAPIKFALGSINALIKRFDILQEGNRKLQEGNRKLQEENEALQKDVANLPGEKLSLEVSNWELQEENEALQKDVANLQKDVANLEVSNRKLQEESNRLLEANVQQYSEKKQLKRENGTLQTDVANLQKKVDSLESMSHELMNDAQKLQKDNIQLWHRLLAPAVAGDRSTQANEALGTSSEGAIKEEGGNNLFGRSKPESAALGS